MARTRMSETGELRIPADIRLSLGLTPGREVEISQEDGRLVVAPLASSVSEQAQRGSLTFEQFLAQRLRYVGPPITDEMIEDAVLQEAERRWDRVRRQWVEDADEDTVD
ncbi:AbrB/MazE/SpoVT family DNA-binding domain-containing protein [Rhizobium sp. YIM 134829]|uniref:AbrB/MazE/SpoVT family DNA-binding domain-containing protein n=1 Tax=Rhizobium sp. YIM 134829 TaxID=3390453 RepID=UPI00397DAD7A